MDGMAWTKEGRVEDKEVTKQIHDGRGDEKEAVAQVHDGTEDQNEAASQVHDGRGDKEEIPALMDVETDTQNEAWNVLDDLDDLDGEEELDYEDDLDETEDMGLEGQSESGFSRLGSVVLGNLSSFPILNYFSH